MGSITKRQRLPEVVNLKQCEDRISNLPSSLIGHILSFLPTKNAVATCILSTTWKQFWTLITTLDFDDELLLHPGNLDSSRFRRMIFTSFVSRVLLLRRVSYLQKFRLECRRRYDVLHVNAWVAASLMYGVQELDLSIPMKHSSHVLPRDLFTCRTLVVLKLGTRIVINVPSPVCLPNLKTLHLDTVKLSDDDSIKRLLLGCPMLEELSMCECIGKDVRAIHIVAPLLLRLIIKVLPYDCLNTTDLFKYKIILDTPALVYLEIDDFVAESYLVKNLCHLIEADISIVAPINKPLDQFEPIHSHAITDLLTAISKVQLVRVWGYGMEAIHLCNSALPTFPNVTYLEIGAPEDFFRWDLLQEFLKSTPYLDTLVFNGVRGDCDLYPDGEPVHCSLPQYELPYALLHLKFIEIRCLGGHEEELDMVEFFLKNAKFLETLTVHYTGNVNRELEVRKKLLKLPRASLTCEVELL